MKPFIKPETMPWIEKLQWLALPLIFVLPSCSNPARNSMHARQLVVTEFNTTEVTTVPNDVGEYAAFRFLVRTQDGAVWYVDTYPPGSLSSLKIESRVQLFPAPGTTLPFVAPAAKPEANEP